MPQSLPIFFGYRGKSWTHIWWVRATRSTIKLRDNTMGIAVPSTQVFSPRQQVLLLGSSYPYYPERERLDSFYLLYALSAKGRLVRQTRLELASPRLKAGYSPN